MRNPKLIGKFTRSLPSHARPLLDELLRLASRDGVALYLVGGPLRDLLLDRSSLDSDIAVEGDAMALARELAAATGGRAVTHPAFLTATVRVDGFHLDLITARSETYAHSGALPTVKPATIREDLLRRDFTINALALRLNGPNAGEILDPTGGLADLDARLIRVLHERSFQDDATRILRAARYACRFDFTFDSSTLDWLRRDAHYLDSISGARLHHELARIFADDAAEATLAFLNYHRILRAVHPALRLEQVHAAAFTWLRQVNLRGAQAAYWPVVAQHFSDAQAAGLSARLALTKPQRAAVQAMPALRDRETALRRQNLKRSAIADLLDPFPLPALWAFAALTGGRVRDRLLSYLTKARHERPHLTGDNLLALGVPEGPTIGDILRRLRNARLDGEIKSRQEEERLARHLIAEGDKANRSRRKRAPSRSS